jgi:glycerol-3-phosphate cytidylyltransferase
VTHRADEPSSLQHTESSVMTRIVTFGTFDLLHVGHVNILRRARALGSHLVVGVSSDELNFRKKGLQPAYSTEDRVGIVAALRYVDEVFVEHSLEEKRAYLVQHRADVLVMGDDWAGKFDEFSDVCRVVYLPRTEGISTTEVKTHIKSASAGPVRARRVA